LTGAPGVGKTTVLTKAVEALKADGISVGGMISREARERGIRVGFEITDLASGRHGWLAHVSQKDGPQVGKYRVNIGDLEAIGAEAIMEAAEKSAVIAIDEIGPMELFSQKFKQAVKQALEGRKTVLAVVHAKANDPLIQDAKRREDTEVFGVTLDNRGSLAKSISKKIFDRLSGL
jgi:nucleoside-triphosphatase